MSLQPPPYSKPSPSSHELQDIEVQPPFTMEETTHAPVHKSGCEVCRAYLEHVAEGSRNFALERFLAQKAEVQRLQSQVENGVAAQVKWHDQYLEQGSDVFSDTFAATAWSNYHSTGARLYINQNYMMTELKLDNLPYKDARYQWDRGFVFPTPQLPGSAIATANSFFSKKLIPGSQSPKDRGRDMIRVFYFGMDGYLCEWVHKAGSGWRKSSLQIKDADPYNIAAICCAQDGSAAWSLFYVTKREDPAPGTAQPSGGRLVEVRCTGGMDGKWSKPIDVGWTATGGMGKQDRGRHSIRKASNDMGHYKFSAAATMDGTNRRIVLLGPSVTRSNSQFAILKWEGGLRNRWLPLKKSGSPQITSYEAIPNYAALVESRGAHIFFQDGTGISEWYEKGVFELWGLKVPMGDGWSLWHPGSDVCSSETQIAATSQAKGIKVRHYVFSVKDGKVIQTTWFSERLAWVSKPISIRNM